LPLIWLLGWRRFGRRRHFTDVEYVHHALRIGQVDPAGQVEEGEQQRGMDCRDPNYGAAFVSWLEVGSVHAANERD